MSVRYKHNHFRSQPEVPQFLLPGDDEMAAIYGFEKMVDKHDSRLDPLMQRLNDLAALIAIKGWDIPGIDVELTVNREHDDDVPIHLIKALKGTKPGEKWAVYFDGLNYNTNENRLVRNKANRVIIPKREIEGVSGYTRYEAYAGDNWTQDENRFHHSKFSAQLKQADRFYTSYELKDDVFCEEKRKTGRYEISSDDVFEQFNNFFDDIVLEINKLPNKFKGHYEAWKYLAHNEEIPLQDMPSLIVCERERYVGDEESSTLTYGGMPLYSGGMIEANDFPNSFVLGKEFHYGFSLPPFQSDNRKWGAHLLEADTEIYKVDLKRANDIYVMDEKAFVQNAAQWPDRLKTLEYWPTDEEQYKETHDHYHPVINTIVPLAEYQGNYEYPVYLINRPLWADEAVNITFDIRKALLRKDDTETDYTVRAVRAIQEKISIR